MTAQIHDKLILSEREYSIVGVKGEGLFNPRDVGLAPVATCTACWRGYVCHYAIRKDKLILDKLQIALGTFEHERFEPRRGPTVGGVEPVVPDKDSAIFNNLYRDMGMEVAFTGGMLIGDGFIDDLYVHMGFHPAWKFENVVELIFDEGTCTETRVVSERIRQIRERIAQGPIAPPEGLDENELREWIESTFDLEYDYW